MMREPRKMVGRRLIRRAGESDADYLAAAEHHKRTIHLGWANLLRIAMERAIASIKLDDDINLRALSDIANVLLTALRETRNGSDDAIRELEGELIAAQADSQLRLQDVVDGSLPGQFSLDNYTLQRDPGDEEYAARRELFVTSRPQIVRRPGVMSGDWVVWGTRVSPEMVEAEVAAGQAEEQILEAYPSLPAGVVAAVQRWRLDIDLISALDDGAVEVLDYARVELSPADPPAIAYLARNKIGEHGDWIVPAPQLCARDLVRSSQRVADLVGAGLHSRLSDELYRLVERWKLKQAVARQDLDWPAWQERFDTPF